jgi:hypothetical protein
MAADARAASSDVSITAQTNRECESTSDRQSVRCISARNTANTERLLGPNCMYPYMIHSHSPSPLHTCRSRCPLGRVSVRQCRNVVTQPDFPHNLVPNLASRPKSDPSPWPRRQAARPDPQFGHRPAPLRIIPESGMCHLSVITSGSVEGRGIPPCAYSVRDGHDFGETNRPGRATTSSFLGVPGAPHRHVRGDGRGPRQGKCHLRRSRGRRRYRMCTVAVNP